MAYQIGLCPAHLAPQVMAFIGGYFRAGHVLASHHRLFDWQYKNREDDTYNFVIARENKTGNLLGILGFINTRQYDPNLADHNSLWLALWQVKPKTGIPSLGLMLLRYLREHFVHESFAVAGINKAHKGMYRAMGFTVTDFEHYYLPHPDGVAPHLARLPHGFKAPPVAASDLSLDRLTQASFCVETKAFPSPIQRFPLKTPTYFYNRYLTHPFYEYGVYAVKRHKQPVGLIATRVATHQGHGALRIVDLIIDQKDLAGLAQPLLELVRQGQCEYADLLQAGLDGSLLLDGGFLRLESDSEIIIPNYFEPFLRENKTITICFRANNPERFQAFRADGDQDRPNRI